MSTIAAIDLAAIYWRHWHATGADSAPDAAARATATQVRDIARRHDHAAVCLDSGTSWRREMYDGDESAVGRAICAAYKATRDEKPPAAIDQLRRVREQLDADGLHLLGADGYEADDVIAGVVEWARAANHSVVIATADKDLGQLVGEGVTWLRTDNGKTLDAAGVTERYGVGPESLGDWLALVGDKSDNVPGVPGVGAKTAAKLLAAYGSIAGIVAALRANDERLTGKLRENLEASQEQLGVARLLVSLRAPKLDYAQIETKRETRRIATTAEQERAVTMATTTPIGGARRMSISAITTGTIERPRSVLIYGPEGVGKSSFGAATPRPIFLGAEDGTGALDVARFPVPHTWQDMLDALDELATAEHDYQTLVIDSIDWAEPLAWDAVCAKGGKAQIEDFGFGKGYVAAVELWRGLIVKLEALRGRKKMNIVLIAHSQIKKLQNPEGDDFDRYSIKLHEKSAAPIKEWVDAMLFASFETLTRETDDKKTKGVETGRRVLRSVRHAAYDAKSRHGIPAELPLEWEAFDCAVRESMRVNDDVKLLLGMVSGDVKAKAQAWLDARRRLPHEMLALKRKLETQVVADDSAKTAQKAVA